jgi:hypothetical protein
VRTYPSLRRALAALLSAVAIIIGVLIMFFPTQFAPAFLIGVTDVMLGVAIVLGIVVVRSHYDN